MKAIKICIVALTLGFAAVMISSTSSSALANSRAAAWASQTQQATPQEQQNPGQAMPNRTPEQTAPAQQNPNETAPQAEPNTQDQQTAQFFVGRIMEHSGEYVLYVPTSRTTYKLDNQSSAKQFNGQNVKVQGTLDSSTNTISVTNIQPATPDP